MDLIIEKNYVRELNIIKKLLDVNDWLSINELTKINKVVLRTVIQDIDNIKRNLPKDWDIILKDSRVKIYKTAQSNYGHIYGAYLKKSFSYQVLRNFFVGTNNSVISLCNDLHVSHSHFYKKIQKVQMLLPKGVHFNLEKLCLDGDEIQIRFIYFNLMSVTDCITDFGFTETSFLSIEKNIKEVLESLRIELSAVGKKHCKYWLGICYKRNKNCIDTSNLVHRNPIESCLNKIYRNSSSVLENKMVNESSVHSIGFYFQPIKYSCKANNNFLNFYERNFELFSLVEGMTNFLRKDKGQGTNRLKLYLIDTFMSDLILKNNPYFKKAIEKSNLNRLN
ncbi:hypothetical protein H6227_002550, partial [Enterococcus faecalis]|nr:hypothetical protein [Enterococcus faecalis]